MYVFHREFVKLILASIIIHF